MADDAFLGCCGGEPCSGPSSTPILDTYGPVRLVLARLNRKSLTLFKGQE